MTSHEELIREWDIQKEKWGLEDWELRLSNQKRHLGYCRPRKKIISISRAFMETNPFPVIKDTLLHEIAHALHYIDTGKTNHNNGWKEVTIRVSCEHKRCATGEGLNMPRGNYIGVCPVCGKETHFYRRVRRSYSCSHCTKRYDPRFKLTIMTIQEYYVNNNRMNKLKG
ncbi:MAG: SprT-like domain-containing protein [Deltaproteobacteria bacterium]|nr:SprT-like domain-containing protein [Deltaproteobacteria bacterium]